MQEKEKNLTEEEKEKRDIMAEQWSAQRANAWYQARPWIRGCNFMGSDCANRIDQWQEQGFAQRLATADRELALAAQTGFNSIRIVLEFFVWQQQHDGFMERLEQYLQTAWKHGISCMIVFGNDCTTPKDENWRPQTLGPQTYDIGYHGGRKNSPHGSFDGVGYSLLDEPALAAQHYEWVREIVQKYREDERVLLWDVFNEPGNSHRKDLSLPHLQKFFALVREIDPIQPVSAGIWTFNGDFAALPPIERYALEHSDIITYHNYGTYEQNIFVLKQLKKLGRPVINTEWLSRGCHNTVQEMFPLFYLEEVGCYNWGFVAGKYQTFEPSNYAWEAYEKDPTFAYDFTKWMHDLYRPSLRPYDPREIELIQRFCAYADADFASRQKEKR